MTEIKLIWRTLSIGSGELQLRTVLRCGQAFRWKKIDDIWSCSLGSTVVFLKQNDASSISYASYPFVQDIDHELIRYFNLRINLGKLRAQWSAKDKNFKKNSVGLEGIRILRQEPWENLISFICSTNNNIKRISSMCETLCVNYGDFLLEYRGVNYYSFPRPERLAGDEVEVKLRELKFGYRAKYINDTAKMVMDNDYDLVELRDLPYEQVRTELLKFKGVGPKVADCVALMSLDKHDAIPVDTHVYQIAKRDYKYRSPTSGRSDTINAKTYEGIRKFFVELWGPYAGWAQSILFAGDLKDLDNGVNIVTVKQEVVEEVVKQEVVEGDIVKQEAVEKKVQIKKEVEETELGIKPEILEKVQVKIKQEVV